MALSVNLDDVRPHLKRPLTTSEVPVAEAHIEALTVFLNARYGDRLTEDKQPLALYYLARAVERGLAAVNANPLIATEAYETSSVTYSVMASRGDLFLTAELATLDSVFGRGGLRVIHFRSGW